MPDLPTLFDPALCKPTMSRHWAGLSWKTFNLLTNPVWVTIGVLVGVAVLLVLLPQQRRRIVSAGCLILLTYAMVMTPMAIALGNQILTWFTPGDDGATAEAIVVLGRGPQQQQPRTAQVMQLWQAHRAPLIFASGINDAPRIVQALEERGIPAGAIAGEGCSRTTEENAQFTAAILQAHGIHRILLVTDSPHLLRSLLTFRSVGFQVIPHATPLSTSTSTARRGFMIYREYAGLLSYGLLGRFLPRTAAPLSTNSPIQPHSSRV